MKFENSFDVSLPPAEAWPVLMDVERIAPCMPGATLTELVDDKTFKGTVSVRLGPVALTFAGEASFEDVDDTAHTANVKAQGRDPKGRGLLGRALAPSRLPYVRYHRHPRMRLRPRRSAPPGRGAPRPCP